MESLPLVVILAIGGVLVWLSNYARKSHLRKWRNYRINNYTITLRQRYPDLIGSELGDGTTLIVRNGLLMEVDTPLPPEQVTLEEYELYTVEGLFKQAAWSKRVDYHSVYGFPTRLSGSAGTYDDSWVIEVVNFHPD